MDSVEATYTVPLALFDLVPVALSVIGCWVLARIAGRAVPAVQGVALLGVVLLGAGGFAKAIWKVILTVLDTDVTWLEQALFPLLSVGFVLLLWALWSGIVGRPIMWWPFALVLAAGYIGAIARGSMTPLLGVAAGSALMTFGVAVRWSVRERSWPAAGLFVLGMTAAIGLAYLAGPKIEQTLTLQWIEEITNAVGQGAILLGALVLRRAIAAADPSASRAAATSDSAVDA